MNIEKVKHLTNIIKRLNSDFSPECNEILRVVESQQKTIEDMKCCQNCNKSIYEEYGIECENDLDCKHSGRDTENDSWELKV